MSTLTITSERALTDLRAGDRVLAIDGHALPRARTVQTPRRGRRAHLGPPAVGLVNDLGTATEWNLYPGNFDVLTIERPAEPAEPAPQAGPRPRIRTVGPVTLVSRGEGFWERKGATPSRTSTPAARSATPRTRCG